MSVDRVLLVCGLIAAVGAALEVLRRTVRGVIGTMRGLARLADDLLGEPARGDRAARPGLLDRLDRIEDRLDRIEPALAELRPNGGGSIKDQIGRIAQATGANQH